MKDFIYITQLREIIIFLEKNSLINDKNYTTSKINLFRSQGKSKNFMISYFFSKGIDKVDINDCITEITEENLNWERDSAKIFIRKKG